MSAARPLHLLACLSLAAGCATPSTTKDGDLDPGEAQTDGGDGADGMDTGPIEDADGDGYTVEEGDCDDSDPNISPTATDTAGDGIDQNCDGVDGIDADGDGAASEASGGDDCDDTDGAIGPQATDLVGDGADQNCDGVDGTDSDGDGHPSVSSGGDDCDDAEGAVYPGATETWYDGVDADCDGASDFDADGDGHDSDAHGGGDCDDANGAVHPGATETWYDGVDADCDGASDFDADADGHDSVSHGGADCDDTDGAIGPHAPEVWYDGVDADCDGASDFDADADGHDSSGWGGSDCDDADSSIHPGATETWYDGVDADCDGASDFDADTDGYDSDAYGGTDCDDADGAVNPGATETWYDGVDTDCDGASDYDADADGYDHDAYSGTDCDDADSAVYPGATDAWYDGVDADCDGASDYDADADGYDHDGYGGTDCDDTDSAVNPAATEVCGNGIDDDCDGGPGSCELSGSASSSSADATVNGNQTNQFVGNESDNIAGGDFDGDGVGDFALGTLTDISGTADGAVYVMSGITSGTTTVASATATLQGAASLDRFGDAVSVFDTDGDGYDDLAVSATSAAGGGTSRGEVYLFFGPLSGTISASAADASWRGSADYDTIGTDLSLGAGALVVGARNLVSTYRRGGAYRVSTSSTGTTTISSGSSYPSSQNDVRAGTSVSTGGDLNGDGSPDVAIGATYPSSTSGFNGGVVYVLFSTGSRDVTAADLYLDAAGSADYLGEDVEIAHDLNNDGYDDILAGARSAGSSNEGAAYVLYGPFTSGTLSVSSADATLVGAGTYSQTGDSVAAGGDVDGDGVSDLLVGAAGYSSYDGRAYLVYGPASGTISVSSADFVMSGANTERLGVSVSFVPDVDGDSDDEILVSGSNAAAGGSSAGAAYLFLGSGM